MSALEAVPQCVRFARNAAHFDGMKPKNAEEAARCELPRAEAAWGNAVPQCSAGAEAAPAATRNALTRNGRAAKKTPRVQGHSEKRRDCSRRELTGGAAELREQPREVPETRR